MLALAALYGIVRHNKQASLLLPKGKNMSYEQFYSQAIQAPRDKAREAAKAQGVKCASCGAVIRISLSTKQFCKCK